MLPLEPLSGNPGNKPRIDLDGELGIPCKSGATPACHAPPCHTSLGSFSIPPAWFRSDSDDQDPKPPVEKDTPIFVSSMSAVSSGTEQTGLPAESLSHRVANGTASRVAMIRPGATSRPRFLRLFVAPATLGYMVPLAATELPSDQPDRIEVRRTREPLPSDPCVPWVYCYSMAS